jgi:hypothetical protein
MFLPKLDINYNEDISKHLKTENKIETKIGLTNSKQNSKLLSSEEDKKLVHVKTKFSNFNINLANRKAYEENKTFVALARERKFKVYFSSKDEVGRKNKPIKNNDLIIKSKEEVDSIFKSLRVNKISDFKNESLLNASDLSLVKNLNNNKSNVFLTGRENDFKNELKNNFTSHHKSFKNIKDKSFDLNENLDNGSKTSNFQNYSKQVRSLIDKSNIEKYIFEKEEEEIYNKISVVPILQKMNTNGNKKTPTIDPDFFLKHSERGINKALCVNFNTNPGLIKSFRKNLTDSNNINLTSFGPEYFLKRKQEEVQELKKRITGSKYEYNYSNQFDTTIFNKYRTTNSNGIIDFGHFHLTSLQPQGDGIKDLMKNRIRNRANRNSKEMRVEHKLNRGEIYQGMIKEIQDSKEKLQEAIDSTLRLTDSDCLRNTILTNEPGFLDFEERNVLGIITQPSIFKKAEDETEGMVRVYQHPKHYRPAKPKKESKENVFQEKKKTKLNHNLVANISDRLVNKPKKETENDLLMKKIKTQDKKLSTILNKIYEPGVVNSTLQGSTNLK